METDGVEDVEEGEGSEESGQGAGQRGEERVKVIWLDSAWDTILSEES